jgi:hypothetical protein
MQDTRTGDMVGLDESIVKSSGFVVAGERRGIPAQYQGPVFLIHEVLNIKGGIFRVERFKHGKMLLRGLPSPQE